MRSVVQRVKRASVAVDGVERGAIEKGLLVYVGVEKDDTDADLAYMDSKIINLRVFEDGEGKMNLDVKEAGGGILLISQFTLHGDCRKGRRPSFDRAEAPARAKGLYEALASKLAQTVKVATGEFQANMEVDSVNDGPVTILLDSRRLF